MQDACACEFLAEAKTNERSIHASSIDPRHPFLVRVVFRCHPSIPLFPVSFCWSDSVLFMVGCRRHVIWLVASGNHKQQHTINDQPPQPQRRQHYPLLVDNSCDKSSRMNHFRSVKRVLVLWFSLLTTTCHGFTPVQTRASKGTSKVSAKSMVNILKENEQNNSSYKHSGTHDLRQWFARSMLTVVMVSTMSTIVLPQPASASYSAYAHREEDWQQRVAQNEIQVSSPKLLRDQYG